MGLLTFPMQGLFFVFEEITKRAEDELDNEDGVPCRAAQKPRIRRDFGSGFRHARGRAFEPAHGNRSSTQEEGSTCPRLSVERLARTFLQCLRMSA